MIKVYVNGEFLVSFETQYDYDCWAQKYDFEGDIQVVYEEE